MSRKCRILLVDDEEDIVTTLKTGLEKEGFVVEAFSIPLEALDAFKAGKYDILLLDVRMPQMSGIQLLKRLAQIDPKVKALFLTAFEIHEKEWHMVLPQSDVDGFIKKPVSIQDLIFAIRKVKSTETP